MTEQRILTGSTATLVSYPRVEFDGTAKLEQPVSVTVRIETPAQVMPDEDDGVAGTVDDLSVKASAAVDEGEDEVACEGIEVVGDLIATHTSSSGTSTIATLSPLSDGVYAYSIAAAGGTAGGDKTDIFTGTLTVDDGVYSLASNIQTNDDANGDGLADITFALIAGASLTVTVNTSHAAGDWDVRLTSTRAVSFQHGRRYLIVGDDTLDVVHAGANDATTLQLAEPLTAAIDDNAPVKGWRVSKALTTAQTGTAGSGLVGNALALWTATFADGSTATWAQTFRIVRRLPTFDLTPTELTQRWSNIRNLVSRQDHNFEETIAGAWSDEIEDLLEKKGIDPEDVTSGEALKSLWALACVYKLALLATNLDPLVRAALVEKWQQKSADFLARSDWYAPPQDASPAPRPEEQPAIRPGYRLVR